MKRPSSGYIRVSPIAPEQKIGHVDELILRGVIEEVGVGILGPDPDEHERWGEVLTPGNTIYYRGGWRVDDCVFIEPTAIICYETA
jgi:hypothetical protein